MSGVCERCGAPTKRSCRRFCSHACSVRSRVLKHGQSNKPTYLTYRGMLARCTNPRAIGYHRYGGRGIAVCDRWLESFENFLEDMGERPEGMTLDRIDVNGNYEPSNCRWATPKEQATTNSVTVLSETDKEHIRTLIATGRKAVDVAKLFGVSDSRVIQIAPVRKTSGAWQRSKR